jgi:hypothetical protein
MSLQYGRRFSLVLGDAAGDGLDLSEMRCTFQTRRATTQTPGSLVVRIYNLSASTVLQVQKEFTTVTMQAGYPDNFGLIFKGEIRQKISGRENATDTWLEILAQDGDKGYNFSVINHSLAAGWKSTDVVQAALDAFDPYLIGKGYIPSFADYPNPRGKVLFGMTRDTMRSIANTTGTTWCINEGNVTMLPHDAPQPGEAFVINAQTGMIGVPQQTIEGISVRCLLNPNIRFGGQIVLNNADIQQARISLASPGAEVTSSAFAGTSTDGHYKVYSVEHSGDTRGEPWYSDLITVAVDGTLPITGPYLNAVASSTDKAP